MIMTPTTKAAESVLRYWRMAQTSCAVPAHNVFTFGDVTFSSNFDNGNLARAEQVPNKSYDFRIWTAPDNMGTPYQSKHCAWYYFMVTGLPQGCVLRIQIVNTSNHSGLYKYDMVRKFGLYGSCGASPHIVLVSIASGVSKQCDQSKVGADKKLSSVFKG
jgi:hypothetical protein